MTANKNKLFAAILLAISGAPLAAQYLMVYPSKDMFAPPTQNINYFKLDNSDFSEFDPVTIEWEVVGSPDSVQISGIGIVANKGSQQIVLGNINEITIAADFRGDIKTKTISTKVMPEIKEFILDKTSFDEYEPTQLSWRVGGSPDSITISGVGSVGKSGSLSATLGNVDSVTLTADYQGLIKSKVIETSVFDRISSFTLSKTSFAEHEPVIVSWKVSGDATGVDIPGIGSNLPKSGSQSAVPGYISSLTLSAHYGEAIKSSTINTTVSPSITSFTLDKTNFDANESVTATWSTVGTPSVVTITGYGSVPFSGSKTAVIGNDELVTLTATYNGVSVKRTIPVTHNRDWIDYFHGLGYLKSDAYLGLWNGTKAVNLAYSGQGDQHIPKTIFGISEIGAYNHSNVGALSHVNFMAGVKIANDLNFSYDNLSNVSGLSSLTTVTNKLHLQKNKITNLAGLSSLASVKDLVVNDNLITSLNGLENLRSAITLSFTLNPLLNDISAIAGVTSTPVYLYLDDRTFTRPIPVNSYFCQKLMAGVNKLYFVSTQSTDYNKVCR